MPLSPLLASYPVVFNSGDPTDSNPPGSPRSHRIPPIMEWVVIAFQCMKVKRKRKPLSRVRLRRLPWTACRPPGLPPMDLLKRVFEVGCHITYCFPSQQISGFMSPSSPHHHTIKGSSVKIIHRNELWSGALHIYIVNLALKHQCLKLRASKHRSVRS